MDSWNQIRDEYVAGIEVVTTKGEIITEEMSLDELALKYDLDYDVLRRKARNDGWDLLKNGFADKNTVESARAANAAQNLLNIARVYIEKKYLPLIEIADNPHARRNDLTDEVMDDPDFLKELNNAATLIERLHKLQMSIDDSVTTSARGRVKSADVLSLEAKKRKLAQLEAEMGFSFGVEVQ
jgi:hypothetical protein